MTAIRTQSKLGLIFLAYIAFISLGLPDGLLGVAWPSMRAEFGQPLDALGLLLLSGMVGYTTASFFSGRIMARLGVGGLLALSCFLTGAALIGYTLSPSYYLIVALGVMAGLGAGAIDAGLNTYIAANFGEGLMQWLHASFGVGITLGPIIMTTGINAFGAWRFGYVAVGVAQIVLAACFFLTLSMWSGTATPAHEEQRLTDYKTPMRETLRQPAVWLSVLMFFIYTGVEVTLGHWVYSLLTEGRGFAPEVAGPVAAGYWGMFTVGRILAGLYARRIKVDTIVRFSMTTALVGSILLWWSPAQWVGLLGVGIVGFAVAPIFPALISGTASRVSSKHAANTIGMQISAAGFGASGLSAFAGVLAGRFSLEIIPIYLIVCVTLMLTLYLLATRNAVPEKEKNG
jgi:fucose permease